MNAADHMQVAENYLRDAQNIPSDPVAAMEKIHRLTPLAADHLDKASALDPTATIQIDGHAINIDYLVADCLQMQGTIEARYGDSAKVVRRGMKAIESTIKYRPYKSDLYLSLAIAHMRLDQKYSAQPFLKKAIELDPTNQYAHQLKDGAKGVELVPGNAAIQFLLDMFSDFRLWATAVPLFWTIYCGYRWVHTIQIGDVGPERSYYMFWFIGMIVATGCWWWLREKLGI